MAMEGSRSPHPADYSRFYAYHRLTPAPAVKPPESLWCGFLCDWTLQDFSGRQPLNDKPSVKEGLTRAGGWPYPRNAGRGKGKINRGKRFVKCPPPTLGQSGRGNNAQTFLKPTSGQPACRHAALVGKREWHRETGKSSRQQGGSVSHQFCTTRFRRIPSKPCRVHHQSSGSRPSF
jgi:hypothetical protein